MPRPSRAARSSARTTSTAWRRPTRPSRTTAGRRLPGLQAPEPRAHRAQLHLEVRHRAPQALRDRAVRRVRAGADAQLADREAQPLFVVAQALELEVLADRHAPQPIAAPAPAVYG